MWQYNFSGYLAHYGKLGMKWGVRNWLRNRATSKTKTATKLKKKSGITEETEKPKKKISEMDDVELKAVVQRLQMEKLYKDLNPVKISAGEKIVKDFVDKALVPAVTEASKQIIKEALVSQGKKLTEKTAKKLTEESIKKVVK